MDYGFPAIEGLVDLLQEYEENRDTYPVMDSFIPEIVAYFKHYSNSL
jgi:hypothetical protein